MPPAQAIPDFWVRWKEHYKTTAFDKASCFVCHSSPKGGSANLNPYGKALLKTGLGSPDVFAQIENRDSDGDGFPNIDEIRAGTLPGDTKSFPTVQTKSPSREAVVVKLKAKKRH